MSEALPFVSVITPTYMRGAGAEKAVISALGQSYPADRFEIVVADGSSSDDTAHRITRLQTLHPGRIVFLREPPLGPSASRNAAVAASRGEILALLDSDCVADPDWMINGIRYLLEHPEVGMLQGRTLPPPHAPLPTRARYIRVEESNSVHEACNMFYRRAAFLSVSGFSREFYMEACDRGSTSFEPLFSFFRHCALVMNYSGEDSDLGWSVLNAGWRKGFCAGALVYHEVRVLTWGSWLVDEGCYAYGAARLIRKFPQARQGLYRGYFLNTAQAGILLLLIGAVLAPLFLPSVLLASVYVWLRSSEPTRFWRGWKRPFRALVYFPRDAATLAILMASSLRYRRLVV